MNVSSVSKAFNYSDLKLVNSIAGKPDWSRIPSKNMKRPSEKELISIIKDTATKEGLAYAAGDVKLGEVYTEKINELRAQYISPVSPDRQAIYEDAENRLNKGLPTPDVYTRRAGTVKVTSIWWGSIEVLEFDSRMGWSYQVTPAEGLKNAEFNDIYLPVYFSAKRSGTAAQGDTAQTDNGERKPQSEWEISV